MYIQVLIYSHKEQTTNKPTPGGNTGREKRKNMNYKLTHTEELYLVEEFDGFKTTYSIAWDRDDYNEIESFGNIVFHELVPVPSLFTYRNKNGRAVRFDWEDMPDILKIVEEWMKDADSEEEGMKDALEQIDLSLNDEYKKFFVDEMDEVENYISEANHEIKENYCNKYGA